MKRKNLLRSLVLISMVGFLIIPLASCANSSSEDEEVTISILTRWPNYTKVLKEELIPEFEEEHPNINIKEPEMSTHGDYVQYIQAAINGDDLPDIFANHPSIPLNELVDLDVVHELDDVIGEDKNDYEEGMWTPGATTMNDNIYAFPIFSNKRGSVFMYYNKRVLNDAGLTESDVPETWDELVDVSEEIKQNTDAYGTYLEMNYWTIRNVVAEMASTISPEAVYTIQNKYLDFKKGEYDYTSEGTIESIKFLKELVDKDLNEPSDVSRTKAQGPGVFAVDKAAFLFSGTFATLDMEKDGFEEYGIAPLPTKDGTKPYATYSGATMAGGLHVSKDTEHYEEVKIFLEFLKDRGFPATIENGAGQPPIPEVVENTEGPDTPSWDAFKFQYEQFIYTPDPILKNEEAYKVKDQVSGKGSDRLLNEITSGYIKGEISDLEGTLQEATDKDNEAFKNALEKVQDEGIDIDKSAWKFPDWNPGEPYKK